MIKLQRSAKPGFLDQAKVIELTDKFIQTQDSVWNHREIRGNLLSSSYEKCAYCECLLNEESKYMEVEHFRDKKHNPLLVVVWSNLLPACKRCNGKKGTHDVDDEPIVNPYEDQPRQHLYTKNYRLKAKTQIGTNTIDALSLNDKERLVIARFDIGEKVQELISSAKDRLDSYLISPSKIRSNKLVSIVENLLKESQKKSEYAACTATVLLGDSEFQNIISEMKRLSLWEPFMDTLYQEADSIRL